MVNWHLVFMMHNWIKNVELNYGDYIGYPVTETEVRYFSVVNDGLKIMIINIL
jgi:hypothetical protein